MDTPDWYFQPFRPICSGALREILDEEFQRRYRFEGISDLFHDLKGLLRRVVVRNEENKEIDQLYSSDLRPDNGR